MATIGTNEFKNGMAVETSDGLFQILEFQHVKPGKGGAFVRTQLKNMRTGAVVDKTFRAGEKMESAFIEKREQQFLYRDGADFVVIDTPPVLNTADAVSAAKFVDGVVVVVDTERTDTTDLLRVRADLNRSGSKILGAVMNRTRFKRQGFLRRDPYVY